MNRTAATMEETVRKLIAIALCILACLSLLTGCVDDKPQGALPAMTVTAHPNGDPSAGTKIYRFALRHEPHTAAYPVAGPEIDRITHLDCGDSTTLEHEYKREKKLSANLLLDITGLGVDLTAQRATMHAIIREAYGIDSTTPRIVRDKLTLRTASNSRTTHRIRWNEIWDENVLVIHEGEKIVASAPFNILTGAELVVIASESVPCTAPVPTSSSNLIGIPKPVPTEQLGDAQQQEASNTPVVSEGPTIEPASTEAVDLVEEYIRSIDAQSWERAYALLHPTYQQRVPFKDYVSGYSPVLGLDIREMSSMRVSRYKEIVDVELLVAAMNQGEESESVWHTEYEVMITRGRPPYQRSITAVRMTEVSKD